MFIFAVMESNIFNYSALWHRLLPIYSASEAQAIVRLLLDGLYGLTLTDIAMGTVDALSLSEQRRLDAMICRLRNGEPVQYILGKAWFGGRQFAVSPSVLIPRPETEDLCRMVVDDSHPSTSAANELPLAVLDVGTGSGCIAVTLALNLPDATVTAIDISAQALKIASANAAQLHADVNFLRRDILKMADPTNAGEPSVKQPREWDVIVSNPPYIMEREKTGMETNVLDYEPRIALFVPDDDPLCFYRATAKYADKTLKPLGKLYFEINPLFAEAITRMLRQKGFIEIIVADDRFGKQRLVKCMKPAAS